jgi:hypothetical protein
MRFSSGLIGTWTKPARAAASGNRLVILFLGSQLATRAPLSRPLPRNPAAKAPTA